MNDLSGFDISNSQDTVPPTLPEKRVYINPFLTPKDTTPFPPKPHRTWALSDRQVAIDTILALVATTTLSINRICNSDPNLPSPSNFYAWIQKDVQAQEDFARAKDLQADVIFEEMREIADTPEEGVKSRTVVGSGVVEELRGDMLEHRKLRIETRKWELSKLKPKKYGDFQRNEITGKDGGAINLVITPVQASIT